MADDRPDAEAADADSAGDTACLSACDLNRCQAQCCYDGVYLREGEEEKLKRIVAGAPEFFDLPDEWIVDGYWKGAFDGRKTATRPHQFTSPDVPAHLDETRCVFCDNDHKCRLQRLAVERGVHKWAYKPRACWLFPLTEREGELLPPPGPGAPDPDDLGPDYPGYVKFVGCGRHRQNGQRWSESLAEEIEYWQNDRRIDDPSEE